MLDGTFSTTQRFLTISREGCFGLSELFRGMRGMGRGERGGGGGVCGGSGGNLGG